MLFLLTVSAHWCGVRQRDDSIIATAARTAYKARKAPAARTLAIEYVYIPFAQAVNVVQRRGDYSPYNGIKCRQRAIYRRGVIELSQALNHYFINT